MNCQFCNHSESEHCPGGVKHGDLKEIGKMLPHPRQTTCVGRHCTQPLCCCVCFKQDAIETPAERDAWLDAMARDRMSARSAAQAPGA